MKKYKFLLVFLPLLLTSCIFNTTKISFAPIPFEMKVDKEIAPLLRVEPMTGEYANQIAQAGVVSALTMYYKAEDKTDHIFMSIYYMPEERFDASKNPNEPPMFGQEVARKDGFVLSVDGPKDSIFEPFTKDGQNITKLYEGIYKKTTYTFSN
jgi:hypothetical protein